MLLYDTIQIDNIVYDSRKAHPGDVFVCLRGAKTDGHLYAKNAYEQGCRVFVCEERLDLPSDALQFIKEDTRTELAELSAALFRHPARALKIIGVTGTKGKTTVSSLIAGVLNRSGKRAAVIGTNGIFIDGKRTPTGNTTPESYELHLAFAEMRDAGIEYAVMEVSSQAFKMHRVHGLSYRIGIFTNLSPDHIGEDEHADFAEYRDCKRMLMERSDVSILNADDAHFSYMAEGAKGAVITYAVENEADFHADKIAMWRGKSALGVTFNCIHKQNEFQMSALTPGEFSVYNALAVTAACTVLGVGSDKIAAALPECRVPGRFEMVTDIPNVVCVIDYAHNPLSMRRALETLRIYSPKRLVCLFGSVGGRTRLRREELGRVASAYADKCILTSDNPGNENPLDIISDIEKGFVGSECEYEVIPDRTAAVIHVVEQSRPGDILLFAGKGHEDYQLIGETKHPFDERKIIEEAAARLPLTWE